MSKPSLQVSAPSAVRRRVARVRPRSTLSEPASGETKSRRGRLSQEDYTRRVCQVMRADPYELEACTVLAQLPAVQALARRHERSIFPLGTVLRALLDQAGTEVEMLAWQQRDETSQRIATFLHIWFGQRRTVVEVAEALGLSRPHVAHTVQKRAMEMVARRFLDLAWRAEASA
jgi:hypothetical protein